MIEIDADREQRKDRKADRQKHAYRQRQRGRQTGAHIQTKREREKERERQTDEAKLTNSEGGREKEGQGQRQTGRVCHRPLAAMLEAVGSWLTCWNGLPENSRCLPGLQPRTSPHPLQCDNTHSVATWCQFVIVGHSQLVKVTEESAGQCHPGYASVELA